MHAPKGPDKVTGMSRALVVVDVQRDFCEEALAVAGVQMWPGDQPAAVGGTQLRRGGCHPDHHVDPGGHFSDSPTSATLAAALRSGYPRCAAASRVGLHEVGRLRSEGAQRGRLLRFRRNRRGHRRTLEDFLRKRGVTEVDVCGIAADYCVIATACDAALAGFETTVLIDLTVAVHPQSLPDLVKEWNKATCGCAGLRGDGCVFRQPGCGGY